MTDAASSLWVARYEGRWVECVTRLVPNGVEVEIVVNGTPLYSRVFPEGWQALEWAEEERAARKKERRPARVLGAACADE